LFGVFLLEATEFSRLKLWLWIQTGKKREQAGVQSYRRSEFPGYGAEILPVEVWRAAVVRKLSQITTDWWKIEVLGNNR